HTSAFLALAVLAGGRSIVGRTLWPASAPAPFGFLDALSLINSFFLSAANRFGPAPNRFIFSIVVLHSLGWIALLGACSLFRSSWMHDQQSDPEKGFLRRFSRNSNRPVCRPDAKQRRLLDRNPVTWL